MSGTKTGGAELPADGCEKNNHHHRNTADKTFRFDRVSVFCVFGNQSKSDRLECVYCAIVIFMRRTNCAAFK